MSEADWVFDLKQRLKRNRRLATVLFYLTDLLYLDRAEQKRFLQGLPAGGRLINLGAGFRASPPGFIAVDRESFPDIAVVADVAALPFRDGCLDAILCEVVLEHVPDSAAAIRELERVLKPGGSVYLSLPFLWPYHASPHDYRRWTVSGIRRELRAFEPVAIGLEGGPTTALINVLHEWLAIALSFNLDGLYRLFYLALIPLLFPLKLLDVLFSRYRNASKIGALYFFHGRKPRRPPEAASAL
jgi:SAM-dependent methyltransferase